MFSPEKLTFYECFENSIFSQNCDFWARKLDYLIPFRMKYYNFCSKIPIYRKKVKKWKLEFLWRVCLFTWPSFFLGFSDPFSSPMWSRGTHAWTKVRNIDQTDDREAFFLIKEIISTSKKKQFQNQNKVSDHCAIYKLCKQKPSKTTELRICFTLILDFDLKIVN